MPGFDLADRNAATHAHWRPAGGWPRLRRYCSQSPRLEQKLVERQSSGKLQQRTESGPASFTTAHDRSRGSIVPCASPTRSFELIYDFKAGVVDAVKFTGQTVHLGLQLGRN